MKFAATLLWLLLLFPSFASAQQLYKWRDEKGQWHLGNAPGEVGPDVQVSPSRKITPSEALASERQLQENERELREAQAKERERQEREEKQHQAITSERQGREEKQREAIARERSLSQCLGQADAEYQANWVRTCSIVEGRPLGLGGSPIGMYQGCAALPFPQADSLNRDRRAARDECYQRYPQH